MQEIRAFIMFLEVNLQIQDISVELFDVVHHGKERRLIENEETQQTVSSIDSGK